MAITEKYLDPFTDFGFKKLFGSEPNKDLLIDFLNQLLPPQHQIQDLTYARNEQVGRNEFDRRAIFDLFCTSPLTDRPAKLQERVFAKLFEAAEIGKFNQAERAQYEESLKVYRDTKNVIDTAFSDGERKKAGEVARYLLKENLPLSFIAAATGLSEAEIEALR